MPDVVSFGELLIDFVSTERGVPVGEAPAFIKAPGGAPANVAVGLAKLGIPTAFMSQLGDDFFGHHLAKVIAEQGVDISALRYSSEAMTALAFVSVDESGERSFVFYRKPSADMLMTPSDLDAEMLKQVKIFHYGSITLIGEPVRSATLAAIEIAQQAGALISYDPNLREPLWENLDAAREGLLLGMQFANVVKMSEEELHFLTDTHDLEQGIHQLWQTPTQLIVITQGEKGCTAFTRQKSWQINSYRIQVEDTIGAGDGFVAGLLSGILSAGKDWLNQELTPILRRANAVGAITASRQGAILALPTSAEVDQFLAEQV